jgi:hypothetical protein
MTITISSDDSRSVKAIEIAAGAGQWLKCRTADGRKLYGVPSQCVGGRYYLVDCQSCTCADAQRHAGQNCKHVLAVRLHCELVKAQQRSTRRPRFVVSHTDSAGNTVYLPQRAQS